MMSPPTAQKKYAPWQRGVLRDVRNGLRARRVKELEVKVGAVVLVFVGALPRRRRFKRSINCGRFRKGESR